MASGGGSGEFTRAHAYGVRRCGTADSTSSLTLCGRRSDVLHRQHDRAGHGLRYWQRHCTPRSGRCGRQFLWQFARRPCGCCTGCSDCFHGRRLEPVRAGVPAVLPLCRGGAFPRVYWGALLAPLRSPVPACTSSIFRRTAVSSLPASTCSTPCSSASWTSRHHDESAQAAVSRGCRFFSQVGRHGTVPWSVRFHPTNSRCPRSEIGMDGCGPTRSDEVNNGIGS